MAGEPQHLVLEPTDRDPREDEAWFQRLPEHAQVDVRDAWRRRHETELLPRRVASAHAWRAVREGMLLMAGCAFVLNVWSVRSLWALLGSLALGALVGAAVGFAAHLTSAGRFRCALLGGGGFLLLLATATAPVVVVFCVLWFAVNLCALWGVRREFRGALGGE